MGATVRLFDQNAYRDEFSASVLSCEAAPDGRFFVILDQTCFFPEEGGQDGDTGRLGDAAVLAVSVENGVITHLTDRPLRVGDTVSGRIDRMPRFRRMQNHTGEHIVSGLIHTRFGLHNVGFHLNDTEVTVDFDGVLTREQLNEIEDAANDAVARNLPVTARYPAPEELAAMTYRSKLDLVENVRIVTIEGIDRCACCAPHVAATGEIGMIKLLDCIHYKGGIRLWMKCGFYALSDYREKFRAVSDIAASLSVKQTEADAAVRRMLDENERLRQRVGALNRRLCETVGDSLEKTDGNICLFFDEDADVKNFRVLVNRAMPLCGGVCAVFAGSDEHGYTYLIGSDTVDLAKEAPAVNAALSGRGGGSSAMISGRVSAPREKIEAYFAAGREADA